MNVEILGKMLSSVNMILGILGINVEICVEFKNIYKGISENVEEQIYEINIFLNICKI